MSATTERRPCQVCGRQLVPKADGLTRNHVRHRGAEDYCGGSGHRQERWPVGQRLRHHAGSVWEVIADLGGTWNDYLLRCVVGTPGWMGGEQVGREMTTHGEYMHRDGWRPVELSELPQIGDEATTTVEARGCPDPRPGRRARIQEGSVGRAAGALLTGQRQDGQSQVSAREQDPRAVHGGAGPLRNGTAAS
jgi:hypothetical protein